MVADANLYLCWILAHKVLNGDQTLPYSKHVKIFSAVQNFIEKSRRFLFVIFSDRRIRQPKHQTMSRLMVLSQYWGKYLALVKCINAPPPPVGLGCCPFKGDGSVVIDLLFNVLPIVCGISVFLSLFCYALLCVHASFVIILKRKRKLVVNSVRFL